MNINNFSLNILFVLLTLSWSSCTSTRKVVKCDDIEILSFTSQAWNGGRPGVGGVNYELTLISTADFKADSLWVKGGGCGLAVTKNGKLVENYTVGDTVVITGGTRNKLIKPTLGSVEENKIDSITPPLEYEGKALFGYSVRGQRKYKVLKEVTIKESLKYK